MKITNNKKQVLVELDMYYTYIKHYLYVQRRQYVPVCKG